MQALTAAAGRLAGTSSSLGSISVRKKTNSLSVTPD